MSASSVHSCSHPASVHRFVDVGFPHSSRDVLHHFSRPLGGGGGGMGPSVCTSRDLKVLNMVRVT